MNEKAIIGCILGTAVGDALELPYEGIAPKRARKLLGSPDRYRFFFGHGMISDDTEHTCMVAQSLIEARDDVDLFVRRFASRLKCGSWRFRQALEKPLHAAVSNYGSEPSQIGPVSFRPVTDQRCVRRSSVLQLMMTR